MKKANSVLLTVLMLVSYLIPKTAWADVDISNFQDRPDITVAVNGNLVNFPDQPPVIDVKAGRTLVPVSFPALTLGDKVNWDAANRQVNVTQEAHDKLPAAELLLTIESNSISVNDEMKQMDTVPIIKGSRTLVPIGFLGIYLGADVVWWDASKTVHVFTQGQTEEEKTAIIKSVADEINKNAATTTTQTTSVTCSKYLPLSATKVAYFKDLMKNVEQSEPMGSAVVYIPANAGDEYWKLGEDYRQMHDNYRQMLDNLKIQSNRSLYSDRSLLFKDSLGLYEFYSVLVTYNSDGTIAKSQDVRVGGSYSIDWSGNGSWGKIVIQELSTGAILN